MSTLTYDVDSWRYRTWAQAIRGAEMRATRAQRYQVHFIDGWWVVSRVRA